MILKNQRGQFVIEAVLLMIVMLGLVTAFIRTARETEILSKIVETPWEKTSGMIESGNWNPPGVARQKVPYQYDRFFTPDAN